MVARVLDASSDLDVIFPLSRKVVANIYDPLYFNEEDWYLNPFRFMDKFYTREAHTYKIFSSDEKLQRKDLPVPKFYGSYSLNIATESGFRTARLILLEHIDGMSMLDAKPEHFPLHTRRQTMKTIISGLRKLRIR